MLKFHCRLICAILFRLDFFYYYLKLLLYGTALVLP